MWQTRPAPLSSAPTPTPCFTPAAGSPEPLNTSAPYDFVIDRPIVFVDLETTGGNASDDRITEIGVVEVGPNGIDQWSTLVDPQQPIPPFIQQLTGINDGMVRGQPSFATLADGLAERLAGKLFVAHNARFDYGFLKNEFRRVGIRFSADVLCTVRLSRALFPSVARHGLDALIARFGLQPTGRHRALADAELLWQFWQKLHEMYAAELVQSAVRNLVRRATLPSSLPENALSSLPERPGVYLFHGDDGGPLYVGKSVNLRQRVAAHFSGDHRLAQDMRISQSIRRIEHRETVGEVGALLLEAHLVKTLTPVYNQRLRKRTSLCSWQMAPDADVPVLVRDRDIDFSRSAHLFGAFGSKGGAESRLRKLADLHGLCHGLLGLEKVPVGRSCFAYQVQQCAGACLDVAGASGAGVDLDVYSGVDSDVEVEVDSTAEVASNRQFETRAEHALRVRQALEPLRLAAWPYPGAVALVERDEAGAAQWHLLENWCYLGSVNAENEIAGFFETAPAWPVFDHDCYVILRQRLLDGLLSVVDVSGMKAFRLSPLSAESVTRRLKNQNKPPRSKLGDVDETPRDSYQFSLGL
ncbi:MAG: exonuclease domain-containing protein [Janthinobacterium lividum]